MSITSTEFVREFTRNWQVLVVAFACFIFAFSAASPIASGLMSDRLPRISSKRLASAAGVRESELRAVADA